MARQWKGRKGLARLFGLVGDVRFLETHRARQLRRLSDHRQVKARKVRFATRRLRARYADFQDDAISFAEFDASVQGWINYVCYANTLGLRRHVLSPFLLKPGDGQKKLPRRFTARQ